MDEGDRGILFRRKGAKVVCVWGMDEFLSVVDDDDNDVTGLCLRYPFKEMWPLRHMYQIRLLQKLRLMCSHKLMWHLELMHLLEELHPIEEIMKLWRSAQDQLVLVVRLVQPRSHVILLRLSWPGNYYFLASFGGCSSGHWHLKPIVAATQQAIEATPTVSASMVFIVTGEDNSAIPSPPVMMSRTAPPPCSPTTGLVSSRKFNTLFSFQHFSSLFCLHDKFYFRYWFPLALFYL